MAPVADDPLYVEEEIPVCDRMAHREGVQTVVGWAHEHVQAVVGWERPIEAAPQSPRGYRSYLLSYDASGRRIGQELLDSSGRVLRAWQYEAGRLLRELAYSRDGQLERRCELVYGSGELWREKRMYAASGEPMHHILADRDATTGRLLTATYVRSGAPADAIREDRYRFDDRGRLVEVGMGPLGECLFEYGEDHGLLTRRSRNLPGASAFGDVIELEYGGTLALPIRVAHVGWGSTVLEYESAPLEETHSRPQ